MRSRGLPFFFVGAMLVGPIGAAGADEPDTTAAPRFPRPRPAATAPT